MDAVFLAGETLALPMHTLSIALHEPGSDAGSLTYETFIADVSARVQAIPRLLHRPWMARFGLVQPRWLLDGSFDLSRHVQHLHVEGSTRRDPLVDVIAALACEPLPRDRPLWQLAFVEGLPGGRTAEILKLHHSISDGVSTSDLLDKVWFADGELTLHTGEPLPILPRLRALHSSLRHFIERLCALPRLVGRTLVGWRSRRHWLRSSAAPPLPRSPASRLGGDIGSRRTFAHSRLSLERLRALKEARGCTLNDVLLAVCSGALRRYLLAHDALPQRSLVASVPLSLGDAPYAGQRGNRVATLFADLATDESAPRQRLDRIVAGMTDAKSVRAAANFDWERWLDIVPPALVRLGMNIYRGLLRRGWIASPINLVISNVQGPARPVARCGHRVEKMFFIGPLVARVGLNITAWSYQGELGIGLLGCPTLIPDITTLQAAFEPALAELERAHGIEPSLPALAPSRPTL